MKREVKALIVSACVFTTGYSMLTFSVPLSAAAIGSSQSELGLIGALFVAPSFFVPLAFGKILDRITSRVVHFIVAAFAVPTLLFAYSSSFVELACIRTLQGFFSAVFWVSIEKELADRSPFEDRGRVIGLYNMSWASAFCFGSPLAGFLIDKYGFKEAFYAAFLLQVAAFAILVRPWSSGIRSEPPFKERLEEANLNHLSTAFFVAGLSGVILGPLFSLFPAYLMNKGFSAIWAGFFILLFSASRVTALLATGLIVDRVGWRLMLGGTLLLTCIVAIGYVDASGLVALMILLGFAFGMAYTTALTLASRSPLKTRGATIGKFETAFNIGVAASSQLGGISADIIGSSAPYVLSGGITMIGFVILLTMARKQCGAGQGHASSC